MAGFIGGNFDLAGHRKRESYAGNSFPHGGHSLKGFSKVP